MADLICRHCGLSIVVPASKCPWCGKAVMVICANCKAYTDDQKSHCEHCGEPLQPDRMEGILLHVRHPDLARMMEDRQQAQLVASAVVFSNVSDFFYKREGFRTILVDLLGSADNRAAVLAGAVFSAYAYLCQKRYCAVRLQVEQEEEQIAVTQLRPWDGQQSVEKLLAEQTARAFMSHEVTEKMVRGLMDFRMSAVEGSPLSAPKIRDAPKRLAFAAIDQLLRLTVLPDHDPVEACRTTYQLLAAFVDEDANRAHVLAAETKRLLCELGSYT